MNPTSWLKKRARFCGLQNKCMETTQALCEVRTVSQTGSQRRALHCTRAMRMQTMRLGVAGWAASLPRTKRATTIKRAHVETPRKEMVKWDKIDWSCLVTLCHPVMLKAMQHKNRYVQVISFQAWGHHITPKKDGLCKMKLVHSDNMIAGT